MKLYCEGIANFKNVTRSFGATSGFAVAFLQPKVEAGPSIRESYQRLIDMDLIRTHGFLIRNDFNLVIVVKA